MRESKIEGYLRREIEKLGGWMQKMTSPGVRACPDNLVMWPAEGEHGHVLASFGRYPSTLAPGVEFIETKAPGGKPTVLQARDHERRRALGFQVHVIGSMEAAEAYLKSRGKR